MIIKHYESHKEIFVFFYQNRCMSLDEKRIDARKSMNCSCIAPKPDTWQPSRINDVRIGKYIFEKALPKLVFNIPSKVMSWC